MQILRCMMPSLVLEKILIHVRCPCTFVFTSLWNYLPLQKWVVLHFNLSEDLFATWMPCASSGEKESHKSPMSHNTHLSIAVSNKYNFSGKLLLIIGTSNLDQNIFPVGMNIFTCSGVKAVISGFFPADWGANWFLRIF